MPSHFAHAPMWAWRSTPISAQRVRSVRDEACSKSGRRGQTLSVNLIPHSWVFDAGLIKVFRLFPPKRVKAFRVKRNGHLRPVTVPMGGPLDNDHGYSADKNQIGNEMSVGLASPTLHCVPDRGYSADAWVDAQHPSPGLLQALG